MYLPLLAHQYSRSLLVFKVTSHKKCNIIWYYSVDATFPKKMNTHEKNVSLESHHINFFFQKFYLIPSNLPVLILHGPWELLTHSLQFAKNVFREKSTFLLCHITLVCDIIHYQTVTWATIIKQQLGLPLSNSDLGYHYEITAWVTIMKKRIRLPCWTDNYCKPGPGTTFPSKYLSNMCLLSSPDY